MKKLNRRILFFYSSENDSLNTYNVVIYNNFKGTSGFRRSCCSFACPACDIPNYNNMTARKTIYIRSNDERITVLC